MKNILLFISIGIILLFNYSGFAQGGSSKYEFRGAWIATVDLLDWPPSNFATSQAQKNDLINQLDGLKETGINAVIFQIRPECDALYNSNYDPWSYWLTGSQGTAPNPYYDPLEFAIEEAHKRGLELHAWFNPYRVERRVGSYPTSPSHVSNQHPSWVIEIGTIKFLDPGLPMVRDYVTNVIMDVVNRYDVDGVHFDDYFYPYPPNQITNQDATTFTQYPRGFSDIYNWRRDNVNIFVEQIQDSINAIKPHVKYGISPFGIWKNGTPPGITGLSAYSSIYCDAVAWLNAQTIDYLAPQCYWKITGGQDYSLLVPWWASVINSRHLYVGQILRSTYSNSEIPNQIKVNRNTNNVHGNILFRSELLLANNLSLKDSLQQNYYKYLSITPSMIWKDAIPPNEPQNLRYELISNSNIAALKWDLPIIAADGDSASLYVVYRFESIPIDTSNLSNPANIVAIEGIKYSIPRESDSVGPSYFVVTSLDRNSNESIMSSILTITAPAISQLVFPANNAVDLPDSVLLQWQNNDLVSSFHLQVSSDSTFQTNLILNKTNLSDTSYLFTNMQGGETYYWRVKAKNAGGTSDFSEILNFTTGFPNAPILAYPTHATLNVSFTPSLGWYSVSNADSYRLQVSETNDFNINYIVVDSIGIIDTMATIGPLQENKIYWWRVKAVNSLGYSSWSDSSGFKTIDPTPILHPDDIPQEYVLEQNYPNPFNSFTNIKFVIKNSGSVILEVYDLTGRIIKTLIDSDLNTGFYNIGFNANDLASGIYIYVLRTNHKILYKKMMLVK